MLCEGAGPPRHGVLCSTVMIEDPVSSDSLQRFNVGDVDVATVQFYDSFVLQPGEGPGYGLSVGVDYGAQVLMGVVRRYLVTFSVHHPFAFDEVQDEAR